MEVIYHYDGSFEGFLSCVFASYAHKESPAGFCSGEDLLYSFYDTRTVSTNPEHAARVWRKIAALSPEAAALLRRGLLTCLPEKELYLYRLLAKLLRDGPGFLGNRSDETLYPVLRAVQHLNGEVHLLKGFVRFSDLGGVLGGEIEPKNRSWEDTSAPGSRASGSSSTTAPTRRPCFTFPANPSSVPWPPFKWPRRTKPRPVTACFGNVFTTPSPSRSGKTPASA